MADSLLITKFHRPQTAARAALVARPRLFERLDGAAGGGARLALLQAPAGFGKSTLAAAWLESRPEPAAWLSLDANDNDPFRFWTYVISAARRCFPKVGEALLPQLAGRAPLHFEALLTDFLNELAGLGQPLLLALDDLHCVDQPEILSGLAFLIEHLPPGVLLLALTRTQPDLPLARLRARRQLVELRVDELRFQRAEADEFLNRLHGLGLTGADLAALDARAEGWAVGLQLAALALEAAAPAERSALIASFSGKNAYVMDYLMEEVLAPLPADLQMFLSQTAVLERLSAPLCAAVVDGLPADFSAEAALQTLFQRGLFLIPLDAERVWFRYHALFADLLRARLARVAPGVEARLHAAACDWLARRGYGAEAMRHALAAGDADRAAAMIEEAWVGLLHSGQLDVVLQWTQALPPAAFERSPLLSVALGWALCLKGRYREVRAQIERAERALADPSRAWSDAETRRTRAELALIETFLAMGQRDFTASLQHASQARTLARAISPLLEGNACILCGHAHRRMGAGEQAIAAFEEGIPLAWQGGNGVGVIGALVALAQLQQEAGDLRRAEQICGDGLRLVESAEVGRFAASATLHLALASVLLEQDRLEESRAALERGLELGRYGKSFEFISNSAQVQARLHLALGQVDEALDVLDAARAVLRKNGSDPAATPLEALLAPLWARTGREPAAEAWLAAQGDLTALAERYPEEAKTRGAARALLALGRPAEALAPLQVLAERARSSQRRGALIEAGVLRAATLRALGRAAEAAAELESARALGEPLGFSRVFHESEPLLAATEDDLSRPRSDLVEPLTPRELEVLRWMDAGCSNQEIADRLVVSLATIKKHTSAVIAKLGASNRGQATSIARRLGLIAPP